MSSGNELTLTPSALLSLALSEALFGDYNGEEIVLESTMLDDEDAEQNADKQESSQTEAQTSEDGQVDGGNKVNRKKSKISVCVIVNSQNDESPADDEGEVRVIQSEITQYEGGTDRNESESTDNAEDNEITQNDSENSMLKIESHNIKQTDEIIQSASKAAKHEHKIIKIVRKINKHHNNGKEKTDGTLKSKTVIELKKTAIAENNDSAKNSGKPTTVNKANPSDYKNSDGIKEASKVENENRTGENETTKTDGEMINLKTEIKTITAGNDNNEGEIEGGINNDTGEDIFIETIDINDLDNYLPSENDTSEELNGKEILEIREELARDYRKLVLLKKEIQKKLEYIKNTVVGDEIANAENTGDNGQGNKTIVLNSRIVVIKTTRPESPTGTRQLVHKLVQSILGPGSTAHNPKGLDEARRDEARSVLQQIIHSVSGSKNSSVVKTETQVSQEMKNNKNPNSTMLTELTEQIMLREKRESEKTRKKSKLLEKLFSKSKSKTRRSNGSKVQQHVYGDIVVHRMLNKNNTVDGDDGNNKTQDANKAFNGNDAHHTTHELNKAFDGNDAHHTTHELNKAFDGNDGHDTVKYLNNAIFDNDTKPRMKRAEENVFDDAGDDSNQDYFVAIGTEPGDKVIEVDPEEDEDDEGSDSEDIVFEFIEEDANAGKILSYVSTE